MTREEAWKEYITAVQLKYETAEIKYVAQESFNEGWRAGRENMTYNDV